MLTTYDEAMRAQASFDLALEPGLLAGEIIIVLDQVFEVAARLIFCVVDLVHAVHPPQVSEFESIHAITFAVDH